MKKIPGPNPLPDESHGRRPVRSFVLREGRLTRGQQKAIETAWPRYGIDNDASPLNFAAMFGNDAPVQLEIGFGMGEALAFSAKQNPHQNYLGIEVHRPGVGTLLRRIEDQQLANVRIICADAVDVLNDRIPADSLAGVRLYFPDPWHKKRHHKRRIVQPDFVQAVVDSMAAGGVFHLATDWENYAEHMLDVVSANPHLVNQAGADNYSARPAWRLQTKFETRGLKLGHGVWDLLFEKQPTNTNDATPTKPAEPAR